MRLEWQRLLRAPLSAEPLRFKGSCAAGHNAVGWDSGQLITPRGCIVAEVKNGIPDFVQATTWATFETTKAQNQDHWIAQGWRRQIALTHEKSFPDVVTDIIAAGPLVVELGAGPGGGHMPMVLERQPDARILVNDFEFRMLEDWKAFLRSTGFGPAASFACFDACAMPLASGSVDCVSSHGCFSNIKAHRDLAVKESFRVLRPGGLLVMMESQIVQPPYQVICDMLKGSEAADPWMLIPGLVSGWTPLVTAVGFAVIKEVPLIRRAVSPEDGDLGRLAHKHGVTMETEITVVVARK